jgi:hypothetical protein
LESYQAREGGGMTYHFHVGRVDDACELIKKFHYSGRSPANIQVCGTLHEAGGLFGDFGAIVAACVFSIPPTRWSEDVLELSRLVRREDVKVSLTGLISKTCVFIKTRKLANLLVSFADWTQEHHGGIYQASSWYFNGKRPRSLDGLIINGTFVAGRSLNSKYGTRSLGNVTERLEGQSVAPHYDEGKFLYWKPLDRFGVAKAKRLELVSIPYPKPNAARQLDEPFPKGVSDVQPIGAAP